MPRSRWTFLLTIAVCLLSLLGGLPQPPSVRATTSAASTAITTVGRDDAGATALANAMVVNSAGLVSAHFDTIPPSGTPHGTAGALNFFPTQGGTFGIMTNGNAAFADAPNNSTSDGANLGGGAVAGHGSTARDVTILALRLAAPANTNCLRLDFAFYSEEYPQYVGSSYNDTFIAEFDQTSWTANTGITAPDNFAYDAKGAVVSVNSTGATSMNASNATGTTYNGGTTLLTAAKFFAPASGSAQHTLYLSIFDQGDNVLDSAAFIDNIHFEQVGDPKDCQSGAQVKRAPLILIPGIGGSQLLSAQTGQEIWPQSLRMTADLYDEYLLALQLAPNGVTPAPNAVEVTVGDILRYEGKCPNPPSTTVLCKSPYGDTIAQLAAAGYTEAPKGGIYPTDPVADLYVFPYDWRLDVVNNSFKLRDFVDQVIAKTGSPKVDILAHSMGGMVTFAYLSQPASVDKVRKVVTLGTPVLGSTKSLAVLKYKTMCFLPGVVPGFRSRCQIDPSVLQNVLLNEPGAYQLLPAEAFEQAVRSPLSVNGKDQSYAQWSAIAKSDANGFPLNAGLLDSAKAYHQVADSPQPLDPNVRIFRVVGDKQPTVDYVEQVSSSWCSWTQVFCKPITNGHFGNGDGTVSLHSADLYNPAATPVFDRRNGIPYAYFSDSHGDLPKDTSVIAFAIAYFGGSTTGDSGTSSASATAANTPAPRAPHDPRSGGAGASSTSTATIASTFGLRDTPAPFSGTMVEITGSATGIVADPDGRTLSTTAVWPTGMDILGGSYDAGEGIQYFFLANPAAYTATLTITDNAPIRLRLQNYAADALAGQGVFTLNLPIGAVVHLNFTTPQDLGTLKLGIDRDGNGTIDEERGPDSVVTGAAVDDTTPPTTTATVAPLGGNQRRITLAAQDDPGGSGVAATYYSVGASAQPQVYTGPFEVSGDTAVRFASIDRAGNTEARTEIPASGVSATMLTLVAGSGGTIGGSPAGTYTSGQVATLNAMPGGGQIFTGWAVDGVAVGWANPLTITMNADHEVRASFAPRPVFGDVTPQTTGATEPIAQLAARGIIKGCDQAASPPLFCPTEPTLRAQMAALIVRAMGWGGQKPAANAFTDRNGVDDELWQDIGILAAHGVAKGYGDGAYGTTSPVLNAQVVSFITRAMVNKGYWQFQADDGTVYPNVAADSGHRQDLVTYVHYAGAVRGADNTTGNFAGWDAPASRAWFAFVFWQALDSYLSVDRVP